ncbi:hypothetical protein ACWEV3_19960 [Saccharopolyspora sp. NPDC003752]
MTVLHVATDNRIAAAETRLIAAIVDIALDLAARRDAAAVGSNE